MSHVTFRLSHVTCYMWNAYVDPWDMLNNFCFHVYTQKWVFVIMSHVTCNMSHCACHMSYVKCLCWFLGHAEQLLFWCLCSKVSICNYVTCHMLHVACDMWHVLCQMLMLILGTCWTTFVFMSMLKSGICQVSNVKMLMLILGTCWTSFVFMSMLKCCFLWMKSAMLFLDDTLSC